MSPISMKCAATWTRSAAAGPDPVSLSPDLIPVRRATWRPAFRIIPSRFPPIDLFERVADPADLEAVLAIEALTNDRLRDEVGDLRLVSETERISGPGTSAIMAAFTHLNPSGSRFSDGSFGVFYCARALDTAIAETSYHRARFLAATREARIELDMRVYLVDLDAELHDLRGMPVSAAAVYAPEDYAAGQSLGRALRAAGAWGVAYDSVRQAGGECAGLFRPRALANCRQERHLAYVWDGMRIASIYEKRALGIEGR